MQPRSIAIAVVLGACSYAGSAHAQMFTFYEGNSCTQDRLGAFSSAQFRAGYGHNMIRALGGNDEARSVRITRLPMDQPYVELELYDAPEPRDADKDDLLHLRIDNARLPLNGICLHSFDRPFAWPGITIVRHKRVNGLDGKVSRAIFRRWPVRPPAR